MEQDDQIIRKSHIFRDLGDLDWQKVRALTRVMDIPRGEMIFTEGEDAHGFYMVVAGRIKVFKLSRDGHEHIIGFFSPGEHFAEAAVFSGGKFPANASPLVNSRLAYFPSDRFHSIVKDSPEIGLFMLAALSRYMHHLLSIIEELSLKDVPARLARFLLEKSAQVKVPAGASRELALTVTKSELALYLGTTSETLSRIIGRMKRLKIISEKKRKIIIHNEPALQEISRGQRL